MRRFATGAGKRCTPRGVGELIEENATSTFANWLSSRGKICAARGIITRFHGAARFIARNCPTSCSCGRLSENPEPSKRSHQSVGPVKNPAWSKLPYFLSGYGNIRPWGLRIYQIARANGRLEVQMGFSTADVRHTVQDYRQRMATHGFDDTTVLT